MLIFLFILTAVIIAGYYYVAENVLYPRKIKSISSLMAESKFEDALKIINQIPEKKKLIPLFNTCSIRFF